MLPGQLIDLPLEQRYSFRKIRLRHIDLLQYFAGFEFYTPQTRTAFLSGTLEQLAVMKQQALGKSIRVMRKNLDYLVTINRSRLVSRGRLAIQIFSCARLAGKA